MEIKLEVCGKIAKIEIESANDFKKLDFKKLGTYNFIVCVNPENENEKNLGCWCINKLLETGFKLKCVNTSFKFYFEA